MKRYNKIIALLAAIVMLLTACAAAEETVTPAPAPPGRQPARTQSAQTPQPPAAEKTPAATETPAATAAPVITATPEVTATPVVTAVPEATAAPVIAATPAAEVAIESDGAAEADDTVLDPEEEIGFTDAEIDEALAAALDKVADMSHILLLGIDARPGEKTGRSDTMVIATLDTDNNVIKLTSLMRDLYVEIPGHKNNRLNAAYVYGGADLLMKTIEHNFNVHIENYVAVNFSMLGDLIDQIGGVELTVESDYYVDRINAVIKEDNRVLGIDVNDGLLTAAGTQMMTGKQAQAYARYRYGTKDGDFGRTVRQREVLMKIFDKVSGKSLTELLKLVEANKDNVYTNLGFMDIVTLAPAVLAMKDAEFEQMRIPIDGAYSSKVVSGMAVLVPNRTKTKQAIADFLTN